MTRRTTRQGSLWHRVCAAAHCVALMLWLTALGGAAIAAAGAFATLPDLGISLRGFPVMGGDEPEEGGRLAAGKMLEPIFTAVDFAQIALAIVVIVTLALLFTVFGEKRRRPANLVRILSIAAATCVLAWHLFFIAPAMNRELRLYWANAEAGDWTTAMVHRDTFRALHPRARLGMEVNFAALLIAGGAMAVSHIALVRREKSIELEEPKLARR